MLLHTGTAQAGGAPLVYHHAHQNKYEEEGGINLTQKCLHTTSTACM